jgi:hypothetical protein
MHFYDERIEELREWLLTQEVQQGVKIIVLIIGALALKLGTEGWKWAYLIASGTVAISWLGLVIYRHFAKAIDKKIGRK